MLIFIHFDFEKYEPRLIALTEHVKYITMVPPRRYRFFYTVNNETYIDEFLHTETLSFPETHTYEMNHEIRTFRVERGNLRSGKPKKIVD